MKYKYVIFDFDGTLADTEKINFGIFQQLSDKYNFKKIAIEEIHQLKKMSAKEVIDFLGIKKTKIPFALKHGKKILKNDIHTVKPCKESTKTTLEKLKNNGLKLGVLTTNSQTNVEEFLKNNEMNIFDFVISASLFGKEIKFKKIIKKKELRAQDILYVGDEIRDIIAAHLSNVKIASVTWGYNNIEALKKHNPDYLINDPIDLLSICLS